MTTRIELLYVKERDGCLWLVRDRGHNIYKDEKEGKWFTLYDGIWIKLDPDTHEPSDGHQLIPVDSIDLASIPEPSWEDEKPMSIFVTLTASVNYVINE